MPKSEDALDQARPRQKFSKAEKRAYAKQMFEQELLQPPKNPIAPLVLPKKPPGVRPDPEEPARAGSPTPTSPRTPPPPVTAHLEPRFNPWHDLIRRMLEIP